MRLKAHFVDSLISKFPNIAPQDISRIAFDDDAHRHSLQQVQKEKADLIHFVTKIIRDLNLTFFPSNAAIFLYLIDIIRGHTFIADLTNSFRSFLEENMIDLLYSGSTLEDIIKICHTTIWNPSVEDEFLQLFDRTMEDRLRERPEDDVHNKHLNHKMLLLMKTHVQNHESEKKKLISFLRGTITRKDLTRFQSYADFIASIIYDCNIWTVIQDLVLRFREVLSQWFISRIYGHDLNFYTYMNEKYLTFDAHTWQGLLRKVQDFKQMRDKPVKKKKQIVAPAPAPASKTSSPEQFKLLPFTLYHTHIKQRKPKTFIRGPYNFHQYLNVRYVGDLTRIEFHVLNSPRQFHPSALYFFEILGDGNCFFYTILSGLLIKLIQENNPKDRRWDIMSEIFSHQTLMRGIVRPDFRSLKFSEVVQELNTLFKNKTYIINFRKLFKKLLVEYSRDERPDIPTTIQVDGKIVDIFKNVAIDEAYIENCVNLPVIWRMIRTPVIFIGYDNGWYSQAYPDTRELVGVDPLIILCTGDHYSLLI